ncbi:MAG TPA: tetratricopeptide repeat protein, partial [Thermomicrobiales bacterium]|nr:tetratricopeptide repeat protein [Thermomicrobiales bacterium]
EFVVPPLALPPDVASPDAPTVADADAVQLFLARARDIRPDLAVDAATLADIAAICRRLDGLPLAIELAAARVNVLPPAALRQRLSERLRLLTGGARDAPERQRTLRDTIAWSYDLLSPAEQRFFQRLAVFAGGWTLEAATAVAADPDLGIDPLDAQTELIDQSLAFLASSPGAAGEPRYGMLETIREYALDRLAASDEMVAIRRRLIDYLIAFAEQADAGLQGPDQASWLDRLDADHDNLRAALGQTLEAGDGPTALRLTSALWRFWRNRGYSDEGRGWLVRALGCGPTAPPALQAAARDGLGHLAIELGDYPAARLAFDEARQLFERLDDQKGLADALSGLGVVAVNVQAYDEAAGLHRRALAIRHEIGDRRGEAHSLRNLGVVARERGNFAEATTLQQRSLAIWRELGESVWIAHALLALGGLSRLQGRDDEAQRQCADSLALLERLGDRFGQAVAETQLGHLARAAGDPPGAMARYGAALADFRAIGVREGIIESIEWIAGVAADLGRADRAVPLFAAATRWRADLGLPPPSASDAAVIA